MTGIAWFLAGAVVGLVYLDELSAVGECIGHHVGEFLAGILFNQED